MTSGRERQHLYRGIASLLLASLLAVLTLAAQPHWHEIAHGAHADCEHEHEEEHREHRCAVDLFVAGSVDCGAAVPIASAPEAGRVVESIHVATEFVASNFLSSSIMEHGPPAAA